MIRDERYWDIRHALEHMLLSCVESELGRAVSDMEADKLRSIVTDEDVQKLLKHEDASKQP